MQINCPQCRTSYDVTARALGPNGRNVRCAKCKEVWLATPGDAILAHALTPAELGAADKQVPPPAAEHVASDWPAVPPVVESPSIVHDPHGETAPIAASPGGGDTRPTIRARRGFARGAVVSRPRFRPSLSMAIGVMAALVIGLITWRTEIVRLLPQTGTFFRMVGLKVNLRNLSFEKVLLSSETVNGAPVLVIDGFVAATGAKPVEIPRLRMLVRDAQGNTIHSWNAVLEQAALQPGERAAFTSRLASPPPNAHEVVVRFFNKRDIATAGGV